MLTPGLRQVLQAVKAEPDDEDSYQDDAAVKEDVINVVADIEAIIPDEACLHCARRARPGTAGLDGRTGFPGGFASRTLSPCISWLS